MHSLVVARFRFQYSMAESKMAEPMRMACGLLCQPASSPLPMIDTRLLPSPLSLIIPLTPPVQGSEMQRAVQRWGPEMAQEHLTAKAAQARWPDSALPTTPPPSHHHQYIHHPQQHQH